MDHWQESLIGCAVISNDPALNTRILESVVAYMESHWPDFYIIDNHIEIL